MTREYWRLALVGLVALAISACTQELTSLNDGSPGDLELDDLEIDCTESNLDFFERAIWPTLSTTCIACHQDTVVTGNSPALSFASNSSSAYDSVREYIEQYGQTFVNKPTVTNTQHSGSRLFALDSDRGRDFHEMVQRVESPVASCIDNGHVAREAGFEDVTNISPARTVRKAAILLQGRMPTDQEIAQAEVNDDGLESVLSNYLQGPSFETWLMNSANDHLLTRKYFTGQTEAQEALSADTYNYTGLYDRTSPAFDAADQAEVACASAGGEPAEDAPQPECVDAYEKRRFAGVIYTETQRAIAEEPLELIRYVVNNNRPYSEVLTADYMMMNPFTYEVLDGSTWSGPYDDMDPTDWRPGHIRQYRVNWSQTLQAKTGQAFVPSAGILTSPVFQLRYPSTDTNRNRARARWTYYYFLGVDIERLAVRAQDPEELKNVTNPGAEGTSCYGCHLVMDPVAGAFQSWGNDGQYLVRNGDDALPQLYVDSDDYHAGDQWYRGQLKPGFNGSDMPVVADYGKANTHDDGLQWLALQMVADNRFATGTARFWFKGLFGRDPMMAPTEESDADYAARMQAYLDEQALIDTWAADFRSSGLNLKTLLVDMMMSPLFRGELAEGADANRLAAIDELGIGRLLTPEQLERKVVATTGFNWKNDWQEDGKLLEEYYMFYGGIDSDGITKRPEILNSLMYSVTERMANEIACEIVAQEFWPGMPKLMFAGVDIETDPTTPAGETAIRNVIGNLLWLLWGVVDADEQDALWGLYKALYDERMIWKNDNDSAGGIYVSDFLSYAAEWDNNRTSTTEDEFCRFEDYDDSDGIDIALNWNSITDWGDVNQIRSHVGSNYNPEQTLRPWVSLLAVMLTDIQFVTE